jgi:rubrerythrin
MIRKITLALIVLALCAPLYGGTTIANLQTAYNGESNAHARYLAFAQKAADEGYGHAASLFRAAARAEQIHANNHAEVLRGLGAEPKAVIETPDVKTTAENLIAAVKGEEYERDTMYPEFMKVAKAEKQMGALRSFTFARTAEGEHARLYTREAGNLDILKGTTESTFFVCPVCGYTTEALDFKNCPRCFNGKENFITVS